MLVIFACGMLATQAAFGPSQHEQLPMTLFAISFGFFIAQHEQPNMIGYYMHYATCTFMLLHAAARISGRRFSAGALLFLAGCTFCYGQSGVVTYLDVLNTSPAAVLLSTVSAAILGLYLYITAFPQGNAPRSLASQPAAYSAFRSSSYLADFGDVNASTNEATEEACLLVFDASMNGTSIVRGGELASGAEGGTCSQVHGASNA